MNEINPQTFELLKTLFDNLQEGQTRIEKKVDAGFGKMNGRVRKLENWRWYLLGMSAVLTFIGYEVFSRVFGK